MVNWISLFFGIGDHVLHGLWDQRAAYFGETGFRIFALGLGSQPQELFWRIRDQN